MSKATTCEWPQCPPGDRRVQRRGGIAAVFTQRGPGLHGAPGGAPPERSEGARDERACRSVSEIFSGKSKQRRHRRNEVQPQCPHRGQPSACEAGGIAAVFKRKGSGLQRSPEPRLKTAATYSPTWWGSTIGADGLNVSVRNGKRWIPAAIAAVVYYKERTVSEELYTAR